jgi:hypothetical protein
MERRLTEERITKSIISWLEKNGWFIICFDFPQSGTGKIIHPNTRKDSLKNRSAIIPDIVAVKNNRVTFFENKDKFILADFKKVENVKIDNDYSNAINNLLSSFTYNRIYFGVGLPLDDKYVKKALDNKNRVDFIVSSDGGSVKIVYQSENIF